MRYLFVKCAKFTKSDYVHVDDYDYEMVSVRHTISRMYYGIIFKSYSKHNILQ